MEKRTLLAPGASKVLDERGKLFGLVYVEATDTGSIERWLFRSKPEYFEVVPWATSLTLATWKDRVTRTAADPDQWGSDEQYGLWIPGSLYIVAKATSYSYGTDGDLSLSQLSWPLPEPSFLYGGSSSEGSRTRRTPAREPFESRTRQLDLGDRKLHQTESIVGRAFGYRYAPDGMSFNNWNSGEYWLLFGGYQSAGAAEGASVGVRKGDLDAQAPLSAFYDLIASAWADGCSLQVTGCNNYQGQESPPESAL